MSRAKIALGIDIGGSKTHAVASLAGETVLDHTTGSANLQSVSRELVGQRLDEIFALVDTRSVGSICAGAAGADSERQIGSLAGMLRERAPLAEVAVVHDTELLLPAARKRTGIALLSGTGSVAFGSVRGGATARAGGWGYLLGDEGSGFWIFREAVRHTLRSDDRGEDQGELGRQLLSHCGCASAVELLDHVYEHQERGVWAKRAELVLALAEQGEPVSARIREQAANALAGLATTVQKRLDREQSRLGQRPLAGTLDVVLAGGLLTNAPVFQSVVSAKLYEAGFSEVSVLEAPPALGALLLAEEAL
ncbi:MAG: N-acetylglucosamine kinase [Segniliparus sp.]|uniref:N-acetylglucosamine kinase n=1 Tax=Segniliparus sp. TaxID=2804064 RepID=UPI003F3A9116